MTSQPGWLEEFTEAVAGYLIPVDCLPPLGCHAVEFDGVHEITLFFGTTEVLGGMMDGEETPARFYCDIHNITKLFDDVQSCHWQPATIAPDDDLGPHVAVEGTYRGHAVWLRVLSSAPEIAQPARVADTIAREFVEQW